jgi:hypothetical protein
LAEKDPAELPSTQYAIYNMVCIRQEWSPLAEWQSVQASNQEALASRPWVVTAVIPDVKSIVHSAIA